MLKVRKLIPQKTPKPVNDDELFTRILYYGVVHLNLSEVEFWLMPIGKLLDLWTCHKQFSGIEKPKHDWTIDEILPM